MLFTASSQAERDGDNLKSGHRSATFSSLLRNARSIFYLFLALSSSKYSSLDLHRSLSLSFGSRSLKLCTFKSRDSLRRNVKSSLEEGSRRKCLHPWPIFVRDFLRGLFDTSQRQIQNLRIFIFVETSSSIILSFSFSHSLSQSRTLSFFCFWLYPYTYGFFWTLFVFSKRHFL